MEVILIIIILIILYSMIVSKIYSETNTEIAIRKQNIQALKNLIKLQKSIINSNEVAKEKISTTKKYWEYILYRYRKQQLVGWIEEDDYAIDYIIDEINHAKNMEAYTKKKTLYNTI